MSLRFFCALSILVTALFGSPSALADERILSYHSDINIAQDGSIAVVETIKVQAEKNQIKRGIYRDFPILYHDRFGNRVKVRFEVLDVSRDGRAEKWHRKERSNGARIYAGDEAIMLDPGVYTYKFRYETNRQLGFFENHDELYWNVTGNGWIFPIDKASARVVLPTLVAAENLHMEGYTGARGSNDTYYQSRVAEGEGYIETSLQLGVNQGLTLAFTWPKGVVDEPDLWDRVRYLLADNLGLVMALIALLGSLVYLAQQWHRIGRDPREGVIFPHYEPPGDHSPASLRYVNRMAYDNKTFTAAVINLAVKGYMSITCEKKMLGLSQQYTLKRESSEASLSPGEQEVLNKLFSGGGTLELKNNNHRIVSGAKASHKKALSKGYHGRYFHNNVRSLLPTAVGSVLMLVVIVISQSFTPLVVPVFVLIVIAHILFAWLLKAPSREGRKLMDKSRGFQLYLEVAEKDELNLRNPPEMTPKLFEAYLPFAVGLGVEQAWSEKFSSAISKLAATSRDSASYHPHWYHGDFDHNNINRFSQSVGKGLNSAISSAAKAPGSGSGSSGGGSSGGGGGGGGGGGW